MTEPRKIRNGWANAPVSSILTFMNDETRQRLERVEAHLTHLEYQVEQLNQVLIQQDKAVEILKKHVKRQSDVLETMELERIKANQTKPPHY